MYGDATNWDEDAYRDAILKEREVLTRNVFRTVWAPSENLRPEFIVVGSSDGTLASYSLPSLISDPAGFSNTKVETGPVASPECLIRGHDGAVYDVKFYGDGSDPLLLSCGDDGGIRGWKWREFIESEGGPVPFRGSQVNPIFQLMNPQHKGPWGALSPIPENNAIAVDLQTGSIFSAAGDCHAYCWDVESSKIKMVFKGHTDYLHCVVARNSTSQIVTSSEDGTARIWDCKSGKCIKVIDPVKKGRSSCVSCVALDESESWLVCGHGKSLSVWNLRASQRVSQISVPAFAQDVVFDGNQILAVGAEPLLRRFDINGGTLSQIHCAPPSVFSVSLHSSGVLAVAGYGGLVDVISQYGSHLCTFRCNGM